MTDNNDVIAEIDVLFQKCMDDDGYWLEDLKSDVIRLIQADQQKQYDHMQRTIDEIRQQEQQRIKQAVEKAYIPDVWAFKQRVLEIIEGKTET